MTLPQPIPGAVPPASAADEQQATVPQQQRPRAPATTRNGRSRSNTYAYNRLDADGNVHHLPPDAPALSSSRSRRSPPGSRSPTTTSAHSPAGPTSALSGGGGGILELLGLSPRSSTSNALHIPFASISGSGSSRPSGPAHGAGEPGPSASPSASPASSVTSADEMPRTPGAVTPPELSVGMSMSTLTDTDTGLGKSTRTRRGGEWSTARALDIDYALDGDAFDEDSSTVVPELASSSSSRRWQRSQARGHGHGHHRSSSVVDRSRDTLAPSLSASTSGSAAPQVTGAGSGYAGGAELGRRVSWSPDFYESGSSSANSGPGRSSVLSWLHGQQSSSYGSPPAANANASVHAGGAGAGVSGNNPVGLFRRLSISSRRPVAATLDPASAANTADERTGRPAGKATSPGPRKLSPMGERMLRSDSSLFS